MHGPLGEYVQMYVTPEADQGVYSQLLLAVLTFISFGISRRAEKPVDCTEITDNRAATKSQPNMPEQEKISTRSGCASECKDYLESGSADTLPRIPSNVLRV